MIKPNPTQNVSEFDKFLSNNQEFLKSKYDQHFINPDLNIKDVAKPQIIAYIYDVFGFSKYQHEKTLNATLSNSLLINFQNFVTQLGQKNSKNMFFTNQIAVKLLRYCILNNEMFAVRYEQKQINEEKSSPPQKTIHMNNRQQQLQTVTKQDQSQQIKQKGQKQPIKKKVESFEQIIEKEEKKDQKHQQKIIVQKIQKQSLDEQNQFSIHLQDQANGLGQVVKKKIKILFDFYCKQLRGTAVNTTFDRINHECSCLNLGKFMVFCNATEVITQQSNLTKQICMSQFKKISQGKRQIQFQSFYELIIALNKTDEEVLKRLGIDDIKKFKDKKKHLSSPFNTKDLSMREVKKYIKIIPRPKIIDKHDNVNKQQVPIQIEKKNIINQQVVVNKSAKNEMKEQKKETSITNQPFNNKIKQIDYQFLHSLIGEQQKGDEIWLKDYLIPKKSTRENSRQNISQSSKIKSSMDRYGGNLMRKENLVTNLRKRVKQMQSNEQKKEDINKQRISKSSMKN